MAQAKSLAVHANGREFQLLFENYGDESGSPAPYHSIDIVGDRLLLSENRAVADFKASVRTVFKSQTGPASLKEVELQNQGSQREFHKPLQAVIQQRKESLRQRYEHAHASSDRAYQVDELRVCAHQGHVQANLDLGVLLDAEGNPECVDFFIEAHNLGHPESLLCLSKTLFKAGDAGAAVRVLLLGARCGSIRCAQLLLSIREHRLHIFEAPECLEALNEGCGYGAIQAKYLLGFVLRHGEHCRDEARGRAVMSEAGAVRHFRADKGKGAPLVKDGNQFPAGTLAHFEQLIDLELLAIRSDELKPEFLARLASLPDEGEKTRASYGELFHDLNPVPERMARRVADWLAAGDDEPVDEAKLERMKALALPDEGAMKEGDHA
ncbi:hypothetical protein PPGU19_004580 [Paraburkholderia sp. PGU19]|uniref:hypothetical protein n=1 Tax=Paraburkholderia sp. PGU19 TaxID=2735434 RepID=UPI0015DBAF14|nr:hypothetical protein [Paraburkholderia sp. PGU19]BCF95889.1 hypothetical protein PPGU19_004580 [Paraburkholderia sp. PGU19]